MRGATWGRLSRGLSVVQVSLLVASATLVGGLVSPPAARAEVSAVPVVSVSDPVLPEGNLGPTNAVFVVYLSRPADAPVTMNYLTHDASAQQPEDYAPVAGVLTIPQGEVRGTINVPVTGDTMEETDERGALHGPPGERFFLELSNSVNGVFGDGSTRGGAYATIENDDLDVQEPPSIEVSNPDLLEGASGTTNAVFVVYLSRPAGSAGVTVDYTTSDSSATAGEDYIAKSGMLTFPPGSIRGTVSVAVMGDTDDDGSDEEFFLDLSNPVNGTLPGGLAAATILEDEAGYTPDPLVPNVDVSAPSVLEGNPGTTTNAVFVVFLSRPAPSGGVAVNFATQDGWAEEPVDYTAASGTLAIAAGQTSGLVNVAVNGDASEEDDEGFVLGLSSATNAQFRYGETTSMGAIIENDDTVTEAPQMAVSHPRAPERDSGVSDAVFVVYLSRPATSPITVNYTTEDWGAQQPSDYTLTTGTLSIPAGASTGTVNVPVKGDDEVEYSNEYFLLQLSGPAGASFYGSWYFSGFDDPAIGHATIEEDDVGVAIDDVSLPEGDAGTKSFTFSVTLTEPSSDTVSVDFSTADDSATQPADYTTTSGTVSFAPGETEKTITVSVKGDTVGEDDEEFHVVLSNPANAELVTETGTGTIENDDPCAAIGEAIDDSGIVVSEEWVACSSMTANTRTNLHPSHMDMTGADVALLTTGDAALAAPPNNETGIGRDNGNSLRGAHDVSILRLNLVVPNAANCLTFDVVFGSEEYPEFVKKGFNDGFLAELDSSTWTVSGETITAPRNFAFDAANGIISVNSSFFDPGSVVEANGTEYDGATQVLHVRTPVTPGPHALFLSVFDAGDHVYDSGAFVDHLQASTATAGTCVAGAAQDALSVSDVTVTEGHSGTRNATFTVTLSRASSRQVNVNYATADDTASSPGDYTSQNGTLTFAPGETTKTVSIPVVGDAVDEANERFTLNLSGATNAAIVDAQGYGTITDDDPHFTINDVTVDPEGHSGTTKNATFTVTLSSASTQTVSVTYATANGTATAGTTADYTAVAPTTLTFSPGQTSKTITVPVTGDNADEANETFRVNLSAPTGGTTIADNQGTGTIIDDDPHLKITDATVTEGHSGTTKNAVFTVTLSSPSSGTVTVKYATTSGTATATTDYTTTTGTLTFAAGQVTKTISVPIKGDNTDESTTAETFTVTLSAPTGGATIADATGAGKITDDDPHFKINDVTVIEGDSGTKTVTFTVTMTSSSKSYSVNFATANNTASSSSDYTAKTGTLTFAAGQTSKTIAITVRGDTTDEGNERFYVNLSSPTGGATLADGRGYGNITDDDP